MQQNNFNPNWVWLLILVFFANASGLLVPVLGSNDAYFYAVISKTMASNHDWVNLYYAGADWLDKPHFPFWMTALSFDVFGVSAFSYVFPGFLFNILGAIYTYRLAKVFFNANTAFIATISYLTSIHLLLSSIDIRAEAYLLGQIMPACFYLWRYNLEGRIKHLLLMAVFSGCALMTKGLFVIVTIFSGQVVYLFYTKQYKKLLLGQWLPLLVSFIFALPEFICLYLQFDLHPEKIVFGHNGVSGIEWFFWGSQFGRFFNSGPIVNQHGNPFFFVHTMLWSFLPWTILFISILIIILSKFRKFVSSDRSKFAYLLGAFIPTFLMFSATKFQLDHYINIIIPFAAILVAVLIDRAQNKYFGHAQLSLGVLLLVLNLVVVILFFHNSWLVALGIIPLFLIWFIMRNYKKLTLDTKLVIIPALAVSSIFMVLMAVNGIVYKRSDAGYNIAKTLPNNSIVYLLDTDKLVNTLGFHADVDILMVNDLSEVSNAKLVKPTYLIINQDKQNEFSQLSQLKPIETFDNIPQDKIVQALLSDSKRQQLTQHFIVYQLN